MDIAHLGFDVDSATAVKATRDLDRLGDQAAMTERQVVGSAGRSTRAFTSMAGATDKMVASTRSFDSRMIAMQLSQVAQQASAGGTVLRALAIQLPDIGLAFGTVGIAAGVAAGALLPLIEGFITGEEEAEDLADALDRVSDVSAGIEDVMDVLGMSVRELAIAYGEGAVQVRRFALAQADIAVDQASRRLSEQLSIMDDLLASYRESYWSVSEYDARVAELVGTLDVTRYQARQLAEAIAAIGDGATFDDQVAAMEDLLALTESMGISWGDLPPEIQDALSELVTYSRETQTAKTEAENLKAAIDGVALATSGAAGAAGALAQNMQAAAAAFSALRAQETKEYSGRGGDPRAFMPGGASADYTSEAGYTPVDVLITKYTPKTGGGRKGGGGGASVDKTADAYDRLMRSLDPVLDAQRDFEENQQILNDALASGIINQDQYALGMGMLSAKFDEATTAAGAFEEVNSLVGDALIDMAMGGANALDTLIERLAEAALQAALLGEGPLAGIFQSAFGIGEGGLIGNITSGLKLPGFAGGGFTGSGARSGGIDGMGGFPAILHPNETVIDHGKGQSAGGTFVYSPNIDARGASEEAVARIAQVMAEDRRNFVSNVRKVMNTPQLAGRG